MRLPPSGEIDSPGNREKGEDQRFLTALILPVKEELEEWAHTQSLAYESYEDLVRNAEVLKLIGSEIAEAINTKNGFKAYERINKFSIITKAFEVGVELSAKQEMMRYKIAEIYKDKLNEMYS